MGLISRVSSRTYRKMKFASVIIATFFIGNHVQALCAPKVNSASDCQKLCKNTADCQHYTFTGDEQKCYMKKASGFTFHYSKTAVSGNKHGDTLAEQYRYHGGDLNCAG